jgi:hypothetical protein
LSLRNVVFLLQQIEAKKETQYCVELRMEKERTSFKLNPDLEDGFRQLNATDRMINAIEREPPPPPPPPAPRIAGTLSVACGTAPECLVVAGGTVRRSEGGTVRINGLPAGKVNLIVHKQGYQLFSEDIDLVEGKAEFREPKFLVNPPDPELPALRLTALLWDLTRATGTVEKVNATGRLYWTRDDKKAQWPVTLKKNSGSSEALFRNTEGKKCTVPLPVSKTQTCKDLKKDPANVLEAAELFHMYQPENLIHRLERRKLAIDGDPRRVRTDDAAPDSFQLTVNEQGLLTLVEHKTATMVSRVQYGMYKDLGTGNFPARIVITQNDGKQTWDFAWESVTKD